jgi:hypothetical protein
VTINTAAAQRALDVLNKKQALLVQQAGTYIEEGVKITQAAIQAGQVSSRPARASARSSARPPMRGASSARRPSRSSMR